MIIALDDLYIINYLLLKVSLLEKSYLQHMYMYIHVHTAHTTEDLHLYQHHQQTMTTFTYVYRETIHSMPMMTYVQLHVHALSIVHAAVFPAGSILNRVQYLHE